MAHAFFALPEVERLAVDKVHSPRFRGYTPVGREVTSAHRDWREVFDVARERPEQPVTEEAPPRRRLIRPNQWPAALPELRAVVTGWLAEVDRLGGLVLRARFTNPVVQPAPTGSGPTRDSSHTGKSRSRTPSCSLGSVRATRHSMSWVPGFTGMWGVSAGM